MKADPYTGRGEVVVTTGGPQRSEGFDKGLVTRTWLDDPEACKEQGAPPDARLLWTRSEDLEKASGADGRQRKRKIAAGFHTTTQEAAEAILRDGPKAFSCEVGFNGRETPKGFFVSSIPLAVGGLEIWIPKLDGKPVRTLLVEILLEDFLGSIVGWELTWPCVQAAIDPPQVLRITPLESCSSWRLPAALERLKELSLFADEAEACSDLRLAMESQFPEIASEVLQGREEE